MIIYFFIYSFIYLFIHLFIYLFVIYILIVDDGIQPPTDHYNDPVLA